MQIVVLIGELCSNSEISKDRLVTHEFGKDLNTRLMLNHLASTYPEATISHANINLNNYKQVINSFPPLTVFINLCDGVETDGYPGLSIVNYLHSNKRLYTGAGPAFYDNTSDKIPLKKMLAQSGVDTCVYKVVEDGMDWSDVRFPVIIKPSVSYGSMLISTKSIVDDEVEAKAYLKELALSGYTDKVFCETFLGGREFTVLVSGSGESCRVYHPAERVFVSSLKGRERILTYDICWAGCDLEKADGEVPPQPYDYQIPPVEYHPGLIDLAKRAYIAVGGTGYGRVDIRTQSDTDLRGFVLEVNANCGLAFGRLASSLGEILILSKVEPPEFLQEIVTFAQNRYNSEHLAGI